MNMFVLAYELARIAHMGQKRRDGSDYFLHVSRVSDRAATFDSRNYDNDAAIVGVLHDIVEDTAITLQTLQDEGFSENIIAAVEALTLKKTDDYHKDYLPRIKANPLALKVKVADIQDNISDRPSKKQMIKYAKALLFLLT